MAVYGFEVPAHIKTEAKLILSSVSLSSGFRFLSECRNGSTARFSYLGLGGLFWGAGFLPSARFAQL